MKNIANVRGFKCQGVCAKLKKSNKKDLAIIISDVPAKVAVTYTKNTVIAEPLKLNKINLSDGKAQALVLNSGNANACTGEQGYKGAIAMAETMAECFNIDAQDVIVFSTGVIGREFPTEAVVEGIKTCAKKVEHTSEAGKNTAHAIMTTDIVPKEYYTEFMVDGKEIRMGAIAKGSGMIHPNMGTMFAFIACDINIGKKLLSKTFKDIINRSFNMISVDGDTSTNDMAIVMCNGLAENEKIKDEEHPGYAIFKEKLTEVCVELAKMIVRDGEGVTKFIEYKVINADTEHQAREIIRTMSDSSLVKTAMFGKDPNWGRLIAAAGRAGVEFDVDSADLYFGDFPLFVKGQPVYSHIKEAEEYLQGRDIFITLNLNKGDEIAMGWGCDLSTEYVIFNSDYTT